MVRTRSHLIGLTANGPSVGATTLAKTLAAEPYHWLHVSMSDYLIKHYAQVYGLEASEVHRNKQNYRRELQLHSYKIGFTSDGSWMARMLRGVDLQHYNVVVEKMRDDVQAQALKHMGFKIIKLEITWDEQVRRAEQVGLGEAGLMSAMNDPVDQGLRMKPDVTLNASATPEWLARVIHEGLYDTRGEY